MRKLRNILMVYLFIISTIIIGTGCAYFTPDAPPEEIEEGASPESDYPEEEI